MSKICKNCGKENKDEDNFCVYCGEKLAKHLICPECEKECVEADHKFCGNCGTKLIPFEDFAKGEKSFVLREDFERVFDEYLPQRKEYGTTVAPIAYFFKQELTGDFINLIDSEIPYEYVRPTVGAGNLAHCPQLSLIYNFGEGNFGLHFVFIFKADMTGVYLSMRHLGRLDSDESLKTRRDVFQYCIKTHFPELEFLKSVDLASKTSFSKSYEKSSIISKFYPQGNIPSDDVLIKDLKDFIECGKLLYDLNPLEDEELVDKVRRRLV